VLLRWFAVLVLSQVGVWWLQMVRRGAADLGEQIDQVGPSTMADIGRIWSYGLQSAPHRDASGFDGDFRMALIDLSTKLAAVAAIRTPDRQLTYRCFGQVVLRLLT
jgi:hypothetical protein